MSSFPTGDPLADTNLLLQVPDSSLASICSSSLYLNELCQKDYFWKLKIEQRALGLIPLRNGFPNYRALYKWISGLQAYMVRGMNTRVYNNIQDAYKSITDALRANFGISEDQIPPIERAQELALLAQEYGNDTPISIYAIPSMISLLKLPTVEDPISIVSPSLADMPLLFPGIFLIYAVFAAQNRHETRVMKLSQENLSKIVEALELPRPKDARGNIVRQVGSIAFNHLMIIRSDNQNKRIFWYSGGIFKSHENPPILVERNPGGGYYMVDDLHHSRPIEDIVEYL